MYQHQLHHPQSSSRSDSLAAYMVWYIQYKITAMSIEHASAHWVNGKC